MKNILIWGLALSFVSNAALANLDIKGLRNNSKADYFCTDGKVIVEAFLDGNIPEEFEFDSSIFKNNHRIKITTEQNTYVYDDLVVATHDGAGQDSFQAFIPDRLAPLKLVVDFYFEHEGAYLSGSFLEILNFNEENVENYDYIFGEDYELDEKMKCTF